MVKAITPLLALPADRIDIALGHPGQLRTLSLIEEFVEQLRTCRTARDYRELQGELVANIYDVEGRRSQCTWAAKRLYRNRPLPDIPTLPSGRNDKSAYEWEFEGYIFSRLARQLRTIGDGMAWRRFGYDRRVIVTLARNQSPGAIYGKKGLARELGFIDEFWDTTGQFALHHDSTNCLRIADVTEFHDDGKIRFVEVKTSARRRAGQTQRAQQAVDALTTGGALPGAGPAAGLALVQVDYATDLDQLSCTLTEAETEGISSVGIDHGRALLAIDLSTLVLGPEAQEQGLERVNDFRLAALRQANMMDDTHHVVGRSIDTATRSPLMVPFSVYPLPPRQCARLICDFLSFETTLSVDALAATCREAGLDTRIELPSRNGALAGDDPVLAIAGRDRTLTVHNQALMPLMYELVDPQQWVQGIGELLRLVDFPLQPHPVFRNEAPTWT